MPDIESPPTPSIPDPGISGDPQPTPAPEPTPVVAGPWIKEDGSFVSDWTHADDIRQISDNGEELKALTKYGTVKDLARGLVHANRLIGQKGVLLPSEHSTPEEVAEFRKATGVPERAEDYQLKPDQLPEGIAWDDNYVKTVTEIAHRNNVPPRVMKEMAAAHLQFEQMRGQAALQVAQQEADRRFAEGTAALQQAWGRDMDFNRRKVAALAEARGCPLDTPGFNDVNMCKLILDLSRDMREDRSVGPAAAGNGMTPGERAHNIQTNKDDADYAAYHGIGREPDPAVQAKVRALHVEEERRKRALAGG